MQAVNCFPPFFTVFWKHRAQAPEFGLFFSAAPYRLGPKGELRKKQQHTDKEETMKRITAFLLALCLCLGLCACGKSEAAQKVDDQITAIGQVTLDSEAAILEAENAAAALTEEERAELENLELLSQLRKDYEQLVLEAKAADVDALITAIGTVTLEQASLDAVAAARKAYDASAPEVQGLVKNLSALTAAEDQILNLQAGQVTDAIAAIGEVTMESGEKIKAAEALLASLSKDAQAKVTNLQVLQAAKEKFQAMKKDQATALLKNFQLEDDPVRGMKFYKAKSHPYYADIRSYVLPYIGMDSSNHVWLCADFHYTGDSWVFFKKLTFAIDDVRHVETFRYTDVSRDNDNGYVWEYINTGDGDQYKDWFAEIAASQKTIVRFEGDDYWYDLTVSSSDKTAIRNILAAYEALLDAGYKNF